MKQTLLIFAILFCYCGSSTAQMSLANLFSGPGAGEIEVVNLSRSGKKILVVNNRTTSGPDTVYFYNLDYSFWKKIICPSIPGYSGQYNIYEGAGLGYVNVLYPSEALFNLDTFLEAAIMYTNGVDTKIFIINENSTITDSITNGAINYSKFRVYETTPGTFKATFSTNSGPVVYDLPGTIPCSGCGGSGTLGLGAVNKQNNFSTEPIPNPSSNEVKITFTLPPGTDQGELSLYNTEGRKIKTYQVDNRFGYIMLDNSLLPAGLYYYNIVVNGSISSTQKIVVLK